jgi:hypothetical protein
MCIPNTVAMGMRGTDLYKEIYYSPGLQSDFSWQFSTNSGFTEDYELYVRMEGTDVDLTPYVTLDKYYVEDVGTGGLVPFSAHLKLPDTPPPPGFHDIRIGARETENIGQGSMGVKTAAEVRLVVIVLCPYYCANIDFSAPNGNENETLDFFFNVRSLSEPDIPVKGRVDIYDGEKLIGVARTDAGTVKKTTTLVLHAPFNTTGLSAGTYNATGTITWGANVTTFQKTFLLGTKTLSLVSYSQDLVKDAINKMQITIKSGWNRKMTNVYAEIVIYDAGEPVGVFKTISADVAPWDTVSLLGYVDTTGLAYKDYPVQIILHFEGATATYDGTISVKEGSATETVDEIPKPAPEKLKVSGFIIALLSFIAVLLLVFVIMLIVIFKKKKSPEKPPAAP